MTTSRPPIDAEGCTPERKRHSKVQSNVRDITPGGMVLSYGDADQEHCYLDWLLGHGLLGPKEDAQPRYDAGYRLREVYYRYRSSRRDLAPSSRTGFLTDHETDADKAEQEFKELMSALPARYRKMVRAMCIGDPRRFDVTRETRPVIYEACEEARDGLEELLRVILKRDRDRRNAKPSCTDHEDLAY